MSIKDSIFKAYDIRGVVPTEIDIDFAKGLGQAMAVFYQKLSVKKEPVKLVVGRDNRDSSEGIKNALIAGLTKGGADVIDIDLSTTPLFYFSVAYGEFDGGVMITASHNPKEYNGFKIVREKAIPVYDKDIQKLKELMIHAKEGEVDATQGIVEKKSFLNDYVLFTQSQFDLSFQKPFTVVIDTGNAAGSLGLKELFSKLPSTIIPLFFELNGSFPNHLPNPLIEDNLKTLKQEVVAKKANLGIAFDGDADRMFLIDEKGKTVGGDILLAFLSYYLLKEDASRKVLYDVRSSRIVPETVMSLGGEAIMGRVGHSFIKSKMRKENIFLAGEISGHYYLQPDYYCESPWWVLLFTLQVLSQKQKSFSELLHPFRKYANSGEVNFEVQSKEKIIDRIGSHFKGGKLTKIDGIRKDFPDWWFSVRASNTEPLLRLVVEAKNKKLLEEKVKEIEEIIKSEK